MGTGVHGLWGQASMVRVEMAEGFVGLSCLWGSLGGWVCLCAPFLIVGNVGWYLMVLLCVLISHDLFG